MQVRLKVKILLISFLIFNATSCSSASWKLQGLAFKDQIWRICTKEIDGEEFHLRGFCRWAKETKSRFILKDLYRRKHFFCAFEDKECLLKFAQSNKTIR